jgi:nicotinamide-nucleotide amidase
MARDRNPLVGTTAQDTVIGVRMVATAASTDAAKQLLDQTSTEVRERLGETVFGQDDETLADAVAALLLKHQRTVATAESCTAGLIAKSLTDVPGSSAYFTEGVVTYSNEAKTRLLEVPVEVIEQHGAVSAETAEIMAVNCRSLSGADYALAVTGIAGPDGGTPDKPVGLVYLALADADQCIVKELRLGEQLTRRQVRDRTRKIALNLLRVTLLRQDVSP